MITFCFSGSGLGIIHVYNEELTLTLLIQILKKNLIKAVDKINEKGEDWSILWDNDSTHTSNKMKEWLQSG